MNDVLSMDDTESIISLLDKISQIMETQFNNLRYEADWKKLSIHLLKKTRWSEQNDPDDVVCESILHEAFGNEYPSAAALLLQGLTPIRFAFMDGQSRMTSLYYYERKLIPCHDGACLPMSTGSGLQLEELKRRWSLAWTGDLATCRIYLPSAEIAGSDVSRSFLLEMRRVSKCYMEGINKKKASLQSIYPNDINDCIINVIEGYQSEVETVNARDIENSVKAAFRHVISSIHQFDPTLHHNFFGSDLLDTLAGLSDDEFVEGVWKRVYGERSKTVFPKLAKRPRSDAPKLLVLMLVVGTALVDVKSRQSLLSCINNDWIVHLDSLASELNEYAYKLDKSTVFHDFPEGPSWFKLDFYLVSSGHR